MKQKRANRATERKKKASSDDFKSVARRLEADEDKGRFEEKLRKIAKAQSGKK